MDWFKKRGYRHFDLPVDEAFAKKITKQEFIKNHSFVPLLHYIKSEKRYKKCSKTGARTIEEKKRPIKFASHRDACILSYYAHQLNSLLEKQYADNGLTESVLAYRSLGRGNYDFAAEVFAYAKQNAPVVILAFDVSSFFDNLDHGLLKRRLKRLLGEDSLPLDWWRIFRVVTSFHYVEMEELKAHPFFGPRLEAKSRDRIASVEELKSHGIQFHSNPELARGNKRGIPQGTPISAALSNLYMIDFDAAAKNYCDEIGALYRRYSDDILVVCPVPAAKDAEDKIMDLIKIEKLEISPHKTERTDFTGGASSAQRAAQYLGFRLHESGAAIRESSLARQWRKMRRAIKRTEKIAQSKIAAGQADRAYTKRLFRRFSHLKIRDADGLRTIRNFSSYARRSATAFGDEEKITQQAKRFEREAYKAIRNLRTLR